MRRGQNTAALVLLTIMAAASGCSDSTTPHEEDDARTGIFLPSDAETSRDVLIVPVDEPDTFIDPCVGATNPTDPSWCDCQPQCCQVQTWFCPPTFGDPTVYSKEVIIDTCNSAGEACSYPSEPDCPPPEVILESECFPAFECPPTTNINYGWQYCELEDGSIGKQMVICDKGQLSYSPCQGCTPEVCDGEDNDCDDQVDEEIGITECEAGCGSGIEVCIAGEPTCFGGEPSEEICDGLDNDCDGETDEFQLNVCGTCGPVPQEECNGIDDDCDGQTDEELVQQCNTACGVGLEICSGGQWQSCTAQQPSIEICDGLDNDCDQQIDEGIECLCTIQDLGVLSPCAELPLLCGQGFKTCECLDEDCVTLSMSDCYAICHWLAEPAGSDLGCDPLIGIELSQEECNNFDDNCNQEIDEDLSSQCYTGPAGTLFVGICEPGIMTCNLGVWGSYSDQEQFIPGYCSEELTPQDEICDGVDNNCDGEVDWGEEIPDTDILFIIDWSGSMEDEISAVLSALNQFASNYSAQDALRWGLMVGPRKLGFLDQETLYVVSDISPFQMFLSDFAGLGDLGMDTGSEMLLDAIYLALQNISFNAPIDLQIASWQTGVNSMPAVSELNLDWRDNAERIVIVFSDEIQQSYLMPEISVGGVISACQATPQSKVYTFSTNQSWKWDEIADNCGGKYFNLTNSATDMYNSLMEILDEICDG